MAKIFKLDASQIRPGLGPTSGCIATDRITVDGVPVGYFHRSSPQNAHDSGWAFLAGDESQAYLDVAENSGIYAVNTIANYDRRILPFLNAPIRSAFAFDERSATFVAVPYMHEDD